MLAMHTLKENFGFKGLRPYLHLLMIGSMVELRV